MTFVDHDQGFVFVGQITNLFQGSNITVHAEHTIGDHHLRRTTLIGGSTQLILEVTHVHVLVAVAFRLAQSNTVDDGSVVELIRDDGVLRIEHDLEETGVRVKAGCVQDRILHAVELADLGLEFLVQILSTADETYGAQSKTMGVHGLFGHLLQRLVIAQAKIVVGAKVENRLLTRTHRDGTLLCRGDHSLALVCARFTDALQFTLQFLLEFGPTRCRARRRRVHRRSVGSGGSLTDCYS
mmetsp:Transcript_38072/g.95765  ORF Transcript_38072/g.95765 Transcript_38072/m.95765 type:complete len:240 (+) Transcript_38072:1486-2205(+)